MDGFRTLGDAGERVEVVDLVGGLHSELLAPLLDLHREIFPEHLYVMDGFEFDAAAPSVRDGYVVHQYLTLVDGVLVGYMTADTNVVRRTAPVHFLAVDPRSRGVRVGGQSLSHLIQRSTLEWTLTDLAACGVEADDERPQTWGGVAEAPWFKLPMLGTAGWLGCPVPYREPIHGWRWREDGLDLRDVALLWMPTAEFDTQHEHPEAPRAYRAAAATFLIDMYRLDPDIDWVADLIGEEADRPSPQRFG